MAKDLLCLSIEQLCDHNLPLNTLFCFTVVVPIELGDLSVKMIFWNSAGHQKFMLLFIYIQMN